MRIGDPPPAMGRSSRPFAPYTTTACSRCGAIYLPAHQCVPPPSPDEAAIAALRAAGRDELAGVLEAALRLEAGKRRQGETWSITITGVIRDEEGQRLAVSDDPGDDYNLDRWDGEPNVVLRRLGGADSE